MAVQRILFVGGKIRTEPESLKLKRGDEVNFTMADDSYASVTLSFSSPSPFDQPTLTLQAGEQATLIVKHHVPKGKYRLDATPEPKGSTLPPPVEAPPPLPPPVPRPPSKDPPGTMAGDLDVTTDPHD